MHNKLVEILESLGIDIAFMEYEGNANEYIIFDIYNELDSNFSDDENLSNTLYIIYLRMLHFYKNQNIRIDKKHNSMLYYQSKF